MSFRLTCYRKLLTAVERRVLPRVFSEERLFEGVSRGMTGSSFSPAAPGKVRYWFHAASVGELESLWSVALALTETEDSASTEFVLTIFSESARKPIERLAGELSAKGFPPLFWGYCPWEGSWENALRAVQPSVFVTAKYEAWPELWNSLATAGIPLIIVGARARKSLRMGKFLTRALGGRLPEMTLLTVSREDGDALLKLFPAARVMKLGEPRWDRVHERANRGNPRARELLERLSILPRPWGVIGSVWASDFRVLAGELGRAAGTVWAVPHRVDAQSVGPIEGLLREEGFRVLRTSTLGSAETPRLSGSSEPRACVLVDEMGFLLELYASADWAFVGGGFGDGIHSTIEPAIHGIPVAGGPARAERFAEVAELVETGELTLLRTAHEFGRWLRQEGLATNESNRQRWKKDVQARLGATQRVAGELKRIAEERLRRLS